MKKTLSFLIAILLIFPLLASAENEVVLEGSIQKAGTYISYKYMVAPAVMKEYDAKLGYILKIAADNVVGLKLDPKKIGNSLKTAMDNLDKVKVKALKEKNQVAVEGNAYDIYQAISIQDSNNKYLYKIRIGQSTDEKERQKQMNKYKRQYEAAKRAYLKLKKKGADLSAGPCLGIIMKDWVADIAHSPREDIDNIPQNQCKAYISGKARHFIELSPEGEFIRAK